jgi:hypothetical protein
MNNTEFKQLVRECLEEVLVEAVKNPKPLESPKVRKTWGDMNPTTRIHGDGKQGFKPKFNKKDRSNWKKDVEENKWIQKAVNPDHKGYCTPTTKSTCTPARKALAMRFKKGDLSKEQTLQEFSSLKKEEAKKMNEMTGTSAVQGFYGKNWCDPDPKRKRMKDIAAKSVGGKVA